MTKISSHWHIEKPAVSSNKGLVASQHYMASEVGANVLRQGGNAIDAAVAAGLTLGTVEPWMSGIGGGGYMTIYIAAEQTFRVIEFGMQAPAAAKATDYPLAFDGTNSSDAFNWPRVVGHVNVEGPGSIAVPGYLSGISRALNEYGSWDWPDLMAPACLQAEQGLPIDWFSAQKINQWSRALRQDIQSRAVYLADGLPPAASIDGHLDWLPLGNLAASYRYLQKHGPESFYQGDFAKGLVSDLNQAGSRISTADLNDYESNSQKPLTASYRDHQIHVSGSLTAGPSLIHALSQLESHLAPIGNRPDGKSYVAMANALRSAYADRLVNLGEGQPGREPGNTSHLCVADRAGNVVSLTQTIMSAFGSRVMLPTSGIMMNNGMMWFDPRPGGPNSVVGGRRPLCNMCPVILESPDGTLTAIGACGGRKIFPAVFQLIVFLTDYGMTVEEAVHQARIDVSGTDDVAVMDHADANVLGALTASFPELQIHQNGVSPNFFALPQLIRRAPSGVMSGGCFIPSPHASVAVAD